MADKIINECLCFVQCYFGSVANENISLVISNFYSDEDLVKAKSVIYDLCVKTLEAGTAPRIITHKKSDSKKKLEADDILKFTSLLDEKGECEAVFVAHDLRKVPRTDPSSADVFVLMGQVDELREKVDSFMSMKQQLNEVQNMVSGLVASSKAANFSKNSSFGNLGTQNFSRQPNISAGTGGNGMAGDTNLRVAIPQSQASGQGNPSASSAAPSGGSRLSYAKVARKPPVVGSKAVQQSSMKASSKPREFHIHLGNLELDTTPTSILDYMKESKVPIRVLDCEILQSSRVAKPRCLSAHMIIDARDKDQAFVADNWPGEVTIRPWRVYRSRFRAQRVDDEDSWH